LLRFLPPGRLYNLVHRFSGYTAAALTVPVAYHCIFLLGFGAYDLRVYIHSILGSTVYRQGAVGALEALPGLGVTNRRRPAVLRTAGAVADLSAMVFQHVRRRNLSRNRV
jgi:hypothetical protein